MSVYRFVHWAASQRTGSGPRKAVLNTLAMMADWQTGRCEAKIETLMEYTELSDGCIRQHLRALEVAGVIAKRHQYRQDGTRRGSEFLILAPGVVEWPDGEQLPSRDDGYQPAGDAGPIRQEVTGGPAGGDGQEQPLKEQPLENSSTKRACATPDLPEGFPDELKPHLKSAYRVLRDLARRQEAREVKPLSLASVVMARPHKPLVKAAHDFAAWADGRAQRQKDVVSGYRNWLDREDDRAAIERLDENGLPAGAPANGRVNGNGRPRGLFADKTFHGRLWEELERRSQENIKEMVSMGMEPWDGGRNDPRREPDPVPARNPNGKSYTAANFASDD